MKNAPGAADFCGARKWFADDARFWSGAALVLGMVSILKGIRFPSGWAATGALVDYSMGLVKRGLFGATLGRLLHVERFENFVVLSYALLALFLVLLTGLTLRSKVFERLGRGEAVAVFASSFAITYMAHLVGYLDIPLGILTMVLLWVRSTRLRFTAAVPVCVCAVAIHESFLLTFLPVLLFSLVLDGLRADEAKARTQMWGMSAVLAGISLGTALWVGHKGVMTAEQVSGMQSALARWANFPLRGDYFEVFERSISDNFKVVAHTYATNRRVDFLFVHAIVIFLPTVVLLVLATRRVIGTLFPGRKHEVAWCAALVASLSPLLMHFIGWDSARWNALTCLECYLVLLLLCQHIGPMNVPLSHGYRNATVLVIALSMATGEGMMDLEQVNAYPFLRAVYALKKSMNGQGWIPHTPKKPVE